MRKLFCRIFQKVNIVLAVALVLGACFWGSGTVVRAASSGSCGSEVSWSINGSTLSITGTGNMSNFTDPEMAPWYDYRGSINAISISDGITSIGNLAFYDFDKLETVKLPNTINSIGEYGFANCDKLSSISLGSSLTVLGAHAFDTCQSLKAVSLPNTLARIGYQAFYRCSSLTSITIPKSVYEMDEAVFAYCENLMQANIEAYLIELPAWTFYGCESLNNVSLSGTIDQVGSKAFYNCTNLEKMHYSGSDDDKQEILDKIQEDITDFDSIADTKDPVYTGNSSSSETKPDGSIVESGKEVIETGNSIVSGTVNKTEDSDGNTYDIIIDATIENESGWQDLLDKTNQYVSYPERLENEQTTVNKIQVNVNLRGDVTIPSDVLIGLAGTKVNMNITTSDGNKWSIDMEQVEASDLAKAYNLTYTMTQIDSLTKEQKALVGDVMSFLVKFEENIPFKVTVKIPLGHSYAGHCATISQKPILKGWEILQTVVIDHNGDAYFYLDSLDKSTEYMVSIDAEGIDYSNALIPDTMQDAYGTLTDEFGNKYVLSGTKSSLGITFKQLTLIVIGIIILCAIVVGIIMFMANKSAKKRVTYDLGYHEEGQSVASQQFKWNRKVKKK